MLGWNTIDLDAGLFTELVEKLGVKGVELNDVYLLDPESLAALAPVYGVIFLFKWRQHDQGQLPAGGVYDTDYQNHNIFFAQQTIQDACATIAVLNCLMNRPEIDLGTDLTDFKMFTTGFDSEMTGDTISNSELIRTVHNSFSVPNSLIIDEMSRPQGDGDLYHFVAYTPINGHIYELDGLRPYPIKHRECSGVDEFVHLIPEVIQQRIAQFGNELRFLMLAISDNRLEKAKRIGDHVGLEHEIVKRDQWRKENMLRRHEHTGLVIELLKNIIAEKSDAEFEAWLDQGRKPA